MTDHDRFAWYCGAGPDQVIIGRQIRLFRNLADLPFPPNAAQQRLQAAQGRDRGERSFQERYDSAGRM